MNKCKNKATYQNYLNRNSFLSEFTTNEDKELARENLGIPELLQEINNKIDSKVIEQGSVAWDLVPTEGNTNKVLSSDALYKAFLKYTLRTELDSIIQSLWENVVTTNRETKTTLEEKFSNLQNLVEQIIETAGGVVFDNKFGNSDYVGIGQKTLTEAFNRIWNKIDEISGETTRGINLVVTPPYFISEESTPIHISANTIDNNGIFDTFELQINGITVATAEGISSFERDFSLTETSVIKCIVKIMGIDYVKEQTVIHYNSFWLGAGNSYQNIMTLENLRPISNGMRGAYDINMPDNGHIIIVMEESLRERFIRADLNSIEIPFIESTVNINNKTYKVFTSDNTYNEGIYNIDING